jgi:hypothetical protein
MPRWLALTALSALIPIDSCLQADQYGVTRTGFKNRFRLGQGKKHGDQHRANR